MLNFVRPPKTVEQPIAQIQTVQIDNGAPGTYQYSPIVYSSLLDFAGFDRLKGTATSTGRVDYNWTRSGQSWTEWAIFDGSNQIVGAWHDTAHITAYSAGAYTQTDSVDSDVSTLNGFYKVGIRVKTFRENSGEAAVLYAQAAFFGQLTN